ncbi:hypothetical protein [Pseudomonas viridiflava]|uniref:hypothetical protein n=1 Tax=Pseudomonas viridiflava TaxID=33069 RepID=UPI000EFCFA3E|nr:hypothetical protein [Pseudomonas viridiflava]
MELSSKNLYETVDGFLALPDKIEIVSEECFRKVYGSGSAKKTKNIVYLFRSEKNVRRLKGESNILYIGQTKHSFGNRYYPFASLHATSKANRMKFEHIIDEYGAISISFHDFSPFGETLIQAEGQLLWWYFQNHCEYPPINYTKTSVRNDILHI